VRLRCARPRRCAWRCDRHRCAKKYSKKTWRGCRHRPGGRRSRGAQERRSAGARSPRAQEPGAQEQRRPPWLHHTKETPHVDPADGQRPHRRRRP
jgi:hypothetical protein